LSVAAVASSLAVVAPAIAAPAPRDHHLPQVQSFGLVPGHPAGPGTKPAVPAAPGAVRPAAPVWPAAGTATVDLPAMTRAGSLPVEAGPPAATPGRAAVNQSGPAVSRAQVRVLDHAAALRAGVSGFLFTVGRADGGTAAGPVTVRLSYAGFAHAFGGGFAANLTVVALPDCALSTPEQARCQVGTPAASVNDAASSTLTAQVDAQPAIALTAATFLHSPTKPAAAAASGTVMAVSAVAAGSTGDYTATSLKPSSSWLVSPQTGDFSWSYPLRLPPAIGGTPPKLSLAYSSGVTDGATAQANVQPGEVGEGFALAGAGFIERKYKSCADEISDATARTGDQCWGGYNAFLSLGGHSSELVQDDANPSVWRLKEDDGSRVELLTGAANGAWQGEHWRVTTTDGTQYWFGRNQLPGFVSGNPVTNSTWTVPVYGFKAGEPCNGATYAASVCDQAWRWNLDLVVDPHGNATSYFYAPETNYYLAGSTATKAGAARLYTRGGYLSWVYYGSQAANVYAHMPMRVQLGYGDRCLTSSCGTQDQANWPDTPWWLSCPTSSCTAGPNHQAPSFWTQKMLTSVTTAVWEGAAKYVDVDSWTLLHKFLPSETTDDLWLSAITHTGHLGGTASLPAVSILSDTGLPNRVAGDGFPAMTRYRVASISSESGAQVAVTYRNADCGASRPQPSQDTLPCFEQWWSPGVLGENPVNSWFYKYPVGSVALHDNTGAALDDQLTSYDYLAGSAAWHFDNDDGLVKDKYKSYSQWRGFQHVKVITGSPQETQGETDYTYMQGMDGDQLPGGGARSAKVTDSQGTATVDSERLNGFMREQINRSGPGGAEVTATINDPWLSAVTADHTFTWGSLTAKMSGDLAVHGRTALAAGGYRYTETDTAHNTQGMVTATSDLGDVANLSDDLCTSYQYAQNATGWMLNYPSDKVVTAAACGTSGAALVSHSRTMYDGQAPGAAPTHGDATETDAWSAGDLGAADHWVAQSRKGYDAYGRVTSETDAAGAITTTAYSSAFGAGNPTTQTVVSNPLQFATTADLDPAFGVPVATTDANGKRTDLAYDPLGRLTAVWLPGQSRSASAKASYTFGYLVTGSTPTAVTTGKLLNPAGVYRTSVALLDGQLRARQTQAVAEAVNGTMLVTDTLYDSRGNAVTGNAPYPVKGAPSATLFGVSQAQVPSYSVSTYDGAGRRTAEALFAQGKFQWQTSYSYGGDRTTVTPPEGGTPTTTVIDARGRKTQLCQYRAAPASGDCTGADATSYSYTAAGKLASVLDAAGNQWSYSYDLLGRRLAGGDPDTGSSVSTYDDLGRLTSATDAEGRTVSYTYDALGRKTGKFDTSGGASTQLAAWTYDSVARGQPASSTSFVNGNAYTQAVTGYDDAYHATGTTVTIPSSEGAALAGTYSFGSTYNVDGTLATESFPAAGGLAAETITHHYDNLGNPLNTVNVNGDTYITSTSWTPDGKPAQYDFGLGQNAQWSALNLSYDVATQRLQEASVQRESNKWANDADVHYSYDNAGDVKGAADTPASGANDVQCFQYDYLQRLTQAWAQGSTGCAAAPSASVLGGPSPYWEALTYDLTGNRLSDTVTYSATSQVSSGDSYPAAGQPQPHTLQAATDHVSGTPTSTRTYDHAGNTQTIKTPSSTQSLSWAADGRLAQVGDSASSTTTSYLYDAGGAQLLVHDPASVTLHLPGEDLVLNGTNVTATRYYTHNGTRVAVRTPGGVSWLMPDPHGTDTIAINASSQEVAQRRFMPFGAPRTPAPSWPGNRGFVGGTGDPSTGFTNLGAREYDPSSGRFLSADPVLDAKDPQQMNGYAYANDNPVTNSDPTGLICTPDNPPPCGGEHQPGQPMPPTDPGGSGGGGGGGGGAGGGGGGCPPPLINCGSSPVFGAIDFRPPPPPTMPFLITNVGGGVTIATDPKTGRSAINGFILGKDAPPLKQLIPAMQREIGLRGGIGGAYVGLCAGMGLAHCGVSQAENAYLVTLNIMWAICEHGAVSCSRAFALQLVGDNMTLKSGHQVTTAKEAGMLIFAGSMAELATGGLEKVTRVPGAFRGHFDPLTPDGPGMIAAKIAGPEVDHFAKQEWASYHPAVWYAPNDEQLVDDLLVGLSGMNTP
jgi:RHS repeat-associated protein